MTSRRAVPHLISTRIERRGSVRAIASITPLKVTIAPTVFGEQSLPEGIEIALTGVAETLLLPLVGRAVDATTPSPILGDS
ncbi:hypothetical protein F5B18DRAFT_650531 [Nemania serpens]|nr:hypothetical protein F5B18DRAFT_650531 [Nemania serpens]